MTPTSDARAALERLSEHAGHCCCYEPERGGDGYCVRPTCIGVAVRAAIAALADAPPATPRPDTHNHEHGAPLVADCDNWCRGKYEHWQKSVALPPATEGEPARRTEYIERVRTSTATIAERIGRAEVGSVVPAPAPQGETQVDAFVRAVHTLAEQAREALADERINAGFQARGNVCRTLATLSDYFKTLPAAPVPVLPAEPGIPGSEVLCEECAKVFCPHAEQLHFHHDGCPACDANDAPAPAVPALREQEKKSKK